MHRILSLGVLGAFLPVNAAAERLLDVDFNTHALEVDGEPSAYGAAEFDSDFPDSPFVSGISSGRAQVAGDGLALRVLYPEGAVGPGDGEGDGGVNFPAPLSREVVSARLAYTVMFEEGFDFQRGGKLPGLSSNGIGTTNSIPSGGNAATGENGFSARSMWRTDGRAVQYVYHLDVPEQFQPFGDDMQWTHADGTDVIFETGETYAIETELTLNAADAADGELRTYLNGELVLERDDLRFRTSDSVLIDSLYISTFHGGSDSSWAPDNDSYIRFDNFTVDSFENVVPEPATAALLLPGLLALRRRTRQRG